MLFVHTHHFCSLLPFSKLSENVALSRTLSIFAVCKWNLKSKTISRELRVLCLAVNQQNWLWHTMASLVVFHCMSCDVVHFKVLDPCTRCSQLLTQDAVELQLPVLPGQKKKKKRTIPEICGQKNRVTLSAYFGQAPFSPKEKKAKTTTQHAVTGVHNLLCVKAAAVTTL